MDCSEAQDLLYLAYDGQITPTQQALLDGHRRTCFACAAVLAKAERLHGFLHKVPQLTIPVGLTDRVLAHVAANSTLTVRMKRTEPTLLESLREAFTWRSAAVFGGAIAAALAGFVVVRAGLDQMAAPPQGGNAVTALIAGSLTNASTQSSQPIADTSTRITPGETLSNDSTRDATVALTPHLALTIGSFSQVLFSRVHTDPRTGDPDVVDVHLERGTLRVHEVLNKDASPVHVATTEATMVPTGTIFVVSKAPAATKVVVTQGSVAVYAPGRVFNVLSGQGVRVLASGQVVRDDPPVIKTKTHLRITAPGTSKPR